MKKKNLSPRDQNIWMITISQRVWTTCSIQIHSITGMLSSHICKLQFARFVQPRFFLHRYVFRRACSSLLCNVLALSRAIIIPHRQEYDIIAGYTSPTSQVIGGDYERFRKNLGYWVKKKKKKRYGERTCEDNGRIPMINERVTGEERDKLFTFFTHGVWFLLSIYRQYTAMIFQPLSICTCCYQHVSLNRKKIQFASLLCVIFICV